MASMAGQRLAVVSIVLMSAITADSAQAQLTTGETAKLRGGTATLTLGRALGAVGVGVSALPPARTTGRGPLVLPIAGGDIKPATGAGTIAERGGLTLKAGGARVRLTDLRVHLASSSVLLAKVGRSRVVLLSLDAGRARVTRSGFDTNVLNLRARLTAAGARVLNRALGVSVLTRGMPLGTAAVRAKFAQLLFIGGATTLTFSPEALGVLADQGIALAPISPGSAAGASFAFPIRPSKIDAKSLDGQILQRGGLSLTKGSSRVEVANFSITLAGRPILSAPGPGDLFALELSAMKRSVSGRTLRLTGIVARLTPEAAAALNQLFGTTAFQTSLTVGTMTVAAKGA
jgi:hypothetical protein